MNPSDKKRGKKNGNSFIKCLLRIIQYNSDVEINIPCSSVPATSPVWKAGHVLEMPES